MRVFLVFSAFLVMSLIPAPAIAQEGVSGTAPDNAATRIEVDSESGEIRFYIDGAPAAVLKDDGLHVQGDINFGGTLRDYGREGFGKIAPNPDALSIPREENVDSE